MIEFAATSFLAFIVIMDPIGLVPIFLAVTADYSEADRRVIARRASIAAVAILTLFGLFGGPLLDYLGISLDALRIAGGLLLFKLAWDMVVGQRTRTTPEEAEDAADREDVAVFPLALPLLVGPGAMTTMLVLLGEANRRPTYVAIVFASATVVLMVDWLTLRVASRINSRLGRTGINVATRILGIILTALSVQLVADGALNLLLASGV
jgi:MarC family membrane protein